MGSVSAQKLWRVLRNVETVLAIELLCASQGMDFARILDRKKPLRAGHGTEAAYRTIRTHVPHLAKDRVLHTDIQKILDVILGGQVVAAVEREIGNLE